MINYIKSLIKCNKKDWEIIEILNSCDSDTANSEYYIKKYDTTVPIPAIDKKFVRIKLARWFPSHNKIIQYRKMIRNDSHMATDDPTSTERICSLRKFVSVEEDSKEFSDYNKNSILYAKLPIVIFYID